MAPASHGSPWRSERTIADDAGALHLAMAGRIVHHRVMLRAAVVPHRHAVRPPPEAHLVLGYERLADEIVEQLRGPGAVILAVAHVRCRVIVREVRGESVDEQNLLTRLRMRAHYRMLGVGVH